jgi:hypothetical protein
MNRVHALDSELDLMNVQSDANTPAAVRDYSDKIYRRNSMAAQHRILFAAFKADVDRYEVMVNQLNSLVDQYNRRKAN